MSTEQTQRASTAPGAEILPVQSPQEHRAALARLTLDAMPHFVALLDATGAVLDVNAPALDAAGVRLEDVAGPPPWNTPWWRLSAHAGEGPQRGGAGRPAPVRRPARAARTGGPGRARRRVPLGRAAPRQRRARADGARRRAARRGALRLRVRPQPRRGRRGRGRLPGRLG